MAVDGHGVSWGQVTTTAQLNGAVDADIAALDAQLGFAAGTHQALEFQELVEFHAAINVLPCSHFRRPASADCGRC